MRSVNPHRLERYIGQKSFDDLVSNMKDWYGGPIALSGVPGEVYATKDDFVGHINAGEFCGALDYARDIVKCLNRSIRISSNGVQINAGFATLTALRQAGYNGPMRVMPFQLVAQATGQRPSSFWKGGGAMVPAAGTDASAAAAGRNPIGGTDGGHYLGSAPTGQRFFFAGANWQPTYSAASTPGECLMLYDRLFDVAKTMSSTGTESVTGTLTRYTSQTTTDPDYIGGNFCFPEVTSSLQSLAHNWTVCQYTNQAGSTAQSFVSTAGVSGSTTGTIDLPSGKWFLQLAAGDSGVKALSQMQNDTSITGTVNFVVAHPIAWMPSLGVQLVQDMGGITSAFNLARIFDSSCLHYIIPISGGLTVNMGAYGNLYVICG